VRQCTPPQLGAPLPCWVIEPVFQQVCCALFVVGSSPVYHSSVCHCVSFIEVIAPDVALPHREPSFTAICGSSHLTRANLCYRPCRFCFSVYCVRLSPTPDCLSPSSLRPTSVPRFLPSISYVPCFVPTYRCSCFLFLYPLDISSSRLMWVWMARHLSRSSCLVPRTTCRLSPPLVLLPPLVHGQLWRCTVWLSSRPESQP